MTKLEYLLTTLNEECAQLIAVSAQTQRMGLSAGETGIRKGITDLIAIITILEDEGILSTVWSDAEDQVQIDMKKAKVLARMPYFV